METTYSLLAILGEQFFCDWEDGARAIYEQVNHHLSISAFYISNHHQEAFRYSIIADPIGHSMLEMKEHGEKYLFMLPFIFVMALGKKITYDLLFDGLTFKYLITLAPYTKLCNTCIQSSTWFFASIEYSTKG